MRMDLFIMVFTRSGLSDWEFDVGFETERDCKDHLQWLKERGFDKREIKVIELQGDITSIRIAFGEIEDWAMDTGKIPAKLLQGLVKDLAIEIVVK